MIDVSGTVLYAFRLIALRAARPDLTADDVRHWRAEFAKYGNRVSGIEWPGALRTVIVWSKADETPGDHELWTAYLAAHQRSKGDRQ